MSESEEVADYQEEEYDEEYDEGEYDEDQAGDVTGTEPEEIRKRVKEMEDELDNLTKTQAEVEKQINSASDGIDENSVYVGQVDYEATPDELRAHFAPCGTINRITIMVDKLTGQAKGFAYVEFVDKESVENALKLDDTPFKGRQLKVLPKRRNVPQTRGGRGRGRGGRFRGGPGRFRGGRGGRGGFRGRGRGAYYGSYY